MGIPESNQEKEEKKKTSIGTLKSMFCAQQFKAEVFFCTAAKFAQDGWWHFFFSVEKEFDRPPPKKIFVTASN